MRVEHSEVHRPEHLPDVENIADYRIVDSFQYRQLLGPADCTFLHKKSGHTRNGRQSEQWNFLSEAFPQLTFDSIERPIVEKQKHKWRCYKHRLRHESTAEHGYHDQITSDPRYTHVIRIGQQC